MQGVITKCLIETNFQKKAEEASKQTNSSQSSSASDAGANDAWLESQLFADRAPDVEMSNEQEEQLSDFEYHTAEEELEDIDELY